MDGSKAGSGTHSTLLSSLLLGRLVVPVLEVLVDSSPLGVTSFGEHGSDTATSLGRLSMHGLVEGGITGVILALEAVGSRRGHVE